MYTPPMWNQVFATGSMAFVVATGCGSPTSPIDNVDDIDVARMPEIGNLVLLAGAPQVLVEFQFVQLNERTCFTVRDEFSAKVAGAPLDIEEPGSAYEDNGLIFCNSPVFRTMSVPVADDAKVVLKDDTGAISCDLGSSLALRTATLVPDGQWQFTAGQQVTVRWTPSSDVSLYTPGLNLSSEDGTTSMGVQVTAQADTLKFTIPATVTPGAYVLNLSEANSSVPPTPISCDVDIDARLRFRTGVTQAITIVP
jgi:hypothetical protein